MSRRCVVCNIVLPPLRWWQRGLLRPLPLCHHSQAGRCLARSLGIRT